MTRIPEGVHVSRIPEGVQRDGTAPLPDFTSPALSRGTSANTHQTPQAPRTPGLAAGGMKRVGAGHGTVSRLPFEPGDRRRHGADEGVERPAAGACRGRVIAVLQRVAVAARRARPGGPAMHAAACPPAHGGGGAGGAPSRAGAAAGRCPQPGPIAPADPPRRGHDLVSAAGATCAGDGAPGASGAWRPVRLRARTGLRRSSRTRIWR